MSTPDIKLTMGPVEWAMLIALSLVWGGSFFFVGVAVADVPPFTIVFSRVAIAAVALWVLIALLRLPVPVDRRVITAFFGMGLLNNAIPFSLLVWGQTEVASGLASILNATTPLFTVLTAHALTSDEKLTCSRLLGVAAGMAGVVAMVGGDALLAGNSAAVAGQLLILGAPVSYAFAGVYGRRFKRYGVNPTVTATGQVTASSLIPAGHADRRPALGHGDAF